ncbi:MAG: VanW family protein [Clostridiales bacterium]|jgi:vancomycin resistance protein YoaR|nr:VanW family protein [Clostridiales bacterium]
MLKALVLGVVILQGIYINDVDIGGLERDAAIAALEATFDAEQKIAIKADDREFAYDFTDFSAGYDFCAAVDEALEFSAEGGFFKNLRKKRALKSEPLRIYAEFSWDGSKIVEIVARIANQAQTPPVEPSYSIANGKFTIKPGVAGREVDQEALVEGIRGVLRAKEGGGVAAEFRKIRPKLSEEDFEKATDLLGSFSTPFDPSGARRAQNLMTANNFLNNQVILPGETLSVCAALRPRTLENGYIEAGQITGGVPDVGLGGGICQISSTLYMAALYAEMTVVQRQNHSLMVAYMEPATDATLAEGLIDLKLKNGTNYPMLIESVLSGNRHTINIYGNENRPAGRQIHFESVLLEIFPAETDFVECPLLQPGMSRLVSFGIDGAKYELYKIITENGRQERVKINTSRYRPLNAVVRVCVRPCGSEF